MSWSNLLCCVRDFRLEVLSANLRENTRDDEGKEVQNKIIPTVLEEMSELMLSK